LLPILQPTSLHDRWNDREQFVRDTLVARWKTVDNVEELRILLYDGTQMTVRATSETELAEIITQGGRRGEIYAKLRTIQENYAGLIRARFPQIPRRVSGYNLDELLPERDSTSREHWSEQKAPARSCLKLN